jgi:hypothetical protein
MVGFLQRRGVTSLVRRLAPGVIHTTNDAYRSLSEDVGIRAKLLPLCGSIPLASDTDPQWLGNELLRLGVSPSHVNPREECWWFGMFGSLHPEWAPEPVFSHIAEAASRARRRVVVSAIGRQGAGAPLWRALQERYGSRFAFAGLGERSPREVSMFLQGLDYGIATTPWQLIGKSATVAAMVDHGLPVIVSRDDVRLRLSKEPRSSTEPLLYRMDAQLPRWLLDQPSRAPARDGLARLAETFLSDLRAATT